MADPFTAVLSGVSKPPGWFYCGVSVCYYDDVRPFFQVAYGGDVLARWDGEVTPTHVSLLVDGTGGTSQLEFRAETGPGYYELDGVHIGAIAITPVPEPAVGTLWGIGFAAFAIARRFKPRNRRSHGSEA